MRDALSTRGRSRWSVAIEAGIWLGAAFLLLAQVGCLGSTSFQPTAATPGVNDKLLRGFGASDGIVHPLRFFSDGSGDLPEEKLVSTFGFSTISSEYLRGLRLSQTFWLEEVARPKLSYEAVLYYLEMADVDDKSKVYKAFDLGSCLTAVNRADGSLTILAQDFRTRMDPRVLGPDGSATTKYTGPTSVWASDKLTLSGFTDGPAKNDPKNPPDLLTAGEGSIPRPNEPPSPACLLQHEVTIDRDTTYRLRFDIGSAVTLDCSRLNSPASCSHTLFPTVKVVHSSRKLARPLEREGQSRVWSWGVDTTSAPLWKENFSPHLQVDTIAIFTEDPSAPNGRRYWTPEHVDVVWDRGGGAMTSKRCNDTIPVDENGVQIQKVLIPDCDTGGFTPTYKRAQLGGPIDDNQALVWKVATTAQDGQTPPWGDAPLYVEFDVAQSCYPDVSACVGTSRGALLGSPPGRDLGNARKGQRTPFERVFRVESVGAGSVRIERVRLEGPNANEFSVRAASGRTFPVVLPFGAFIELSLDAQVQSEGDKRADVVVEFNALGAAQPERIRLGVVARGVAPDIMVLPSIVRFSQQDASPAPSSASQAGFITVNNGSSPAQRQQMRITGPHASYFVIRSSEYNSIVHTPPTPAQTLGSGESELVRLAYRPQMPGSHAATVEIQTDAGTYTVQLSGTCTGVCHYEVPPVWTTPDIGVLVLGDARRAGIDGDLKVTVDQLTPGLAGTLVSLQGTDQVSTAGETQLSRCLEDVELNRELLSAEAWQNLERLNILKKEQARLPGGRLQVCYRLTPLGERVTKVLKATSSFRYR